MAGWKGLELGRILLAFSALMYAGIWVQVSLFHRAGAFKKLAMYGPVILTPLVIGGALAGAVRRDGIWGWVALVTLSVGVLDGLGGFYYHVRGITSQIGGLSMRNLLSGPPPILPIAYSLIGVLGLIALFYGSGFGF